MFYMIKGMAETFKVVYNACYGGFDLSVDGLKEYNRRSSKQVMRADEIGYDDPVLIDMVETMDAKEINTNNSHLKIKEFPIAFQSFLLWHDYDGKESVRIDYNKYMVESIKKIIDIDIIAEEKIKRIYDLYHELQQFL